MTGRDLYRTQFTLMLVSLATLLACSVHILCFATSGVQYCIDSVVIAMSTLVIIFADDLARKLNGYESQKQNPEKTMYPNGRIPYRSDDVSAVPGNE